MAALGKGAPRPASIKGPKYRGPGTVPRQTPVSSCDGRHAGLRQ